jgi:DNA-binding beta-propeller fold protein YncE/predicted small secreted protein
VFAVSFSNVRRLLAGAVVISASMLLSSCGNTYRATVGQNNPPPPPSQSEYLPIVISQVDQDQSQGLASILDASGDSLIVQVHVGNEPVNLALGAAGTAAYVVNLAGQAGNYYQGSLSSFGVTTQLQDGSVNTSSLNSQTNVFVQPSAPGASLCSTGTVPAPPVFANSNVIYVGQTGSDYLLPLVSNATSTGVPGVLSQLPTAGVVTNFAGLTTGTRAYAIETAANTVQAYDSTNLPSTGSPTPAGNPFVFAAGTLPNYGLMSPDGYRTFILNCNGTIATINSQSNLQIGTITLPAAPDGTPAGSPIFADYVNANNILVTANTNGSTGTPGTASIINGSETAAAFGTVLGTVTVGNNPSGVAVLQDNSRAYVLNQDDATVSIINLTSLTAPPTVIPLTYSYSGVNYSCPAIDKSTSPPTPGGGTQIVATPGTTYQQVFVLCTRPNPGDGAYYVYSIRTYQDSAAPTGQSTAADVVSSAIPVSGTPVQIRMTPSR